MSKQIPMPEKGSKAWRELPFSQREGFAPLPAVLDDGVLSKQFRDKVSVCLTTFIKQTANNPIYVFQLGLGRSFWEDILDRFSIEVLERPITITIKPQKTDELIKWLHEVVRKEEGQIVIELLEYILRAPNAPYALKKSIEGCFDLAPYAIDREGKPVCIVPVASEEMKANVVRSLENINQSELTGTKKHLKEAAQALNGENFADATRESIHAVVAAARTIDPKASKTIGPALTSLEKSGLIKHPALTEAFKKLYGYTSDEQGIRHPLRDKEKADVGFDEAMFMYAACVAFVDFLVSKQKQMENGE